MVRLGGILKMLLIAPIFMLAGCDDWRELYDDCPNDSGDPAGRITLVTEWDGRSADASIPDQYRAIVGNYWEVLSGTRNTLDYGFEPGDYDAVVYNKPEKFLTDDLTGVVAPDGTGIDAMPGYMFTWSGRVLDLKADEVREIIAPMKQQVGLVHYRIVMDDGSDIGQHISAVDAQVDNIASKIDIYAGTISAPAYMRPAFALDSNEFKATSRMLGTVGASQTLTLDLTLTGRFGSQRLTTDIGGLWAGFNDNKTDVYYIVITITQIGINGAIQDWTAGGEYNGNID